ncbi:MAG: fatty acid desaturase [Saprospiraceae bacterium]|nr:fatty acid desaturase [Saprospiraceae bacterium]
MQDSEIKKFLKNWNDIVAEYSTPSVKKATIQILNSFLPFIGLWVLMYFSLDWSYWITLGLAAVNAFFLVRIFIIQHDCGHQSFLRSRNVNNTIGFIASFFSTIPYKYWARSHNYHHAHCGQLEVRDIGDIEVLTVEEFESLSKAKQIQYRVFRSPIVMFLIGPIWYLGVTLRLPLVDLKGWKKTYRSQFFSNVYMLLVYALLGTIIGWQEFFMVQVPIIVLFGVIAVWFFYVQHQHEDTYKQWKENWEYLLAAIKGSTHYKLPKLVQWLTGNIGFHHIHHLGPKIPNYNLEKCYNENPVLNKFVTSVTFKESLKCMFNKLWDEEQQKMITFREYKNLSRTKTKLAA